MIGQRLDRDQVKRLMFNWRCWALDCPPDSAEIAYYRVSPMFKYYVKPTPGWLRYSNAEAEAVEDVLKIMHHRLPDQRQLLINYWIFCNSQRQLAALLAMPRTTLQRKIDFAHDAFADYWRVLQ